LKRLKTLEKLTETIQNLQQQICYQQQQMDQQQQEIADLKTVLPVRYCDRVLKSTVKILDSELKGVGVGFFISPNRIITCAHNFPSFESQESTAKSYTCENFKSELIVLKLLRFMAEEPYDIVVFSTDEESPDYLQIASPDKNSQSIAITSFRIGLAKAAKNSKIIAEQYVVLQGTLTDVSSSHIVYTSNLFSGDSGAAVISHKNGEVIAMHLETINEANEKLEDSRLSMKKLNESISSLISGLSQGFLGLRLDTEIIRNFIK
jgi:hypothetical protein